jgi:hypothetical protein
MTVRILSPANAGFSIESARQPLPQKENIGVSRLMVKVAAPTGTTTISILLSPQWPSGATAYTSNIVPLSNW